MTHGDGLGIALTLPGEGTPRLGREPESFEDEFRQEVARLVQEVLHRNYVALPALAEMKAIERGSTVEELVATIIAHKVMKKVDREYL